MEGASVATGVGDNISFVRGSQGYKEWYRPSC